MNSVGIFQPWNSKLMHRGVLDLPESCFEKTTKDEEIGNSCCLSYSCPQTQRTASLSLLTAATGRRRSTASFGQSLFGRDKAQREVIRINDDNKISKYSGTLLKARPPFHSCSYSYSYTSVAVGSSQIMSPTIAQKVIGYARQSESGGHYRSRGRVVRSCVDLVGVERTKRRSSVLAAASEGAGPAMGFEAEEAMDDPPHARTNMPSPSPSLLQTKSARTLKVTRRGIVWSDDEIEVLLERLRSRFGDWYGEMVRLRKQIHAFPELAFLENVTSELVVNLLSQWGYDVHRGLGGTGVVATLSVGEKAKEREAIMLRADMDALPIREENAFAHRSTRQGVMHACGHDGHTTMLLGAARILSQSRKFQGTVHLLFQPAEEGTLTENSGKRVNGGAIAMLNEGLLEKFPVRAAFAMHNWPGLPVGQFAVHSGPVMAAVDNFYVEVGGVGCHAGMPHLGQGRDPIICAAQIVTALQSLVSRSVDPQDSAVVSVTQVHGGDAINVVPESVLIKGTMRTFNENTRKLLMDGFRRMVGNTASAHGCTSTVEFRDHFPATINTPAEASLCLEIARKVVGERRANLDTVPPSMGAEDFGYILQRVPGCYLWIGNGPAEGGCMLHNPKYDFNDDALAIGASFWVELVESQLPIDE